MPGKKYQVFVSSTYKDLEEERQTILRTLMEMDCIPASMELFPAADEEQFEFIKKIIDDSDYYLLIIGGKYGTVTSDGMSFTEKEYDYAISKGIKVIAFIHSNPSSLPVNKSDTSQDLTDKLHRFRNRVSIGRLVKFWSKPEELPGLVALSLINAIKVYPAFGWERVKSYDNANLLDQINKLRIENDDLKQKIENCNMLLKNRHDCKSLSDIIRHAKNTIFVNGVTLITWAEVMGLLESRSDLQIRLLVFDFDNAELIKVYKDMRGDSSSYSNEQSVQNLKRFMNCSHIEVRKIKSFTPMLFVAADLDTNEGYIRAVQFLNNSNSLNFPHVELSPVNKEWYDIYRNQIETIWARGTPLNG